MDNKSASLAHRALPWCALLVSAAFCLGIFAGPVAYADELPDALATEPQLVVMADEGDVEPSEQPETDTRTKVEQPSAVEGLVYTGTPQAGVVQGEGYTLQDAEATEAGTYTATATLADGEATVWSDGTTEPKSITFTISPAPLGDAAVTLASDSVEYSGSAQKPEVTSVSLPDGTVLPAAGYTVTYANNINVGTATVTITAAGNYEGTAQTTFAITPRAISGATIAKIAAKTYAAKALKPAPVVKWGSSRLKSGTDYTVSYKNNTKAGKATVIVAGKGNYAGSASTTFTISPRDFSKATIAKISAKTYTGKAIAPAPVVKWGKTKLKKGVDYTVSYKKNKAAGTAVVIVKGKGNYSAKQKTATFKIAKRALTKTKVTLSFTSVGWTGGKKAPAVTVKVGGAKLRKGVDYTVSYANNVLPGRATVIVKGKGSLTGSLTKSFTITKGETVYLTRTGECYHLSWCSSLRRSKIPTTLYDARMRGSRPCHNCNP